MAENLTPGDDDGPTKGHNRTAMIAGMQDAFRRLLDAERKKKAAEQNHVQPYKDDIARLWKNLKTDTGFDRKYMEAEYRLFVLQEKAKDLEEDDRNQALDAMRMAHEALTEGGMLDFVEFLTAGADKPNGGDAPAVH